MTTMAIITILARGHEDKDRQVHKGWTVHGCHVPYNLLFDFTRKKRPSTRLLMLAFDWFCLLVRVGVVSFHPAVLRALILAR